MRIYHDPADITPAPPLALGGGGFQKAFEAFTEQERQEFQRAYYAGVSFMDAQVGRLLDTLDRLNLWETTVVMFVGDNGYHHNERNWWNKNTLFERSCRVPMIVAAPGAKAGGVCPALVELVDLYPTVADYCGVRAAHAGRSQLAAVAGEPRSSWQTRGLHLGHPRRRPVRPGGAHGPLALHSVERWQLRTVQRSRRPRGNSRSFPRPCEPRHD